MYSRWRKRHLLPPGRIVWPQQLFSLVLNCVTTDHGSCRQRTKWAKLMEQELVWWPLGTWWWGSWSFQTVRPSCHHPPGSISICSSCSSSGNSTWCWVSWSLGRVQLFGRHQPGVDLSASSAQRLFSTSTLFVTVVDFPSVVLPVKRVTCIGRILRVIYPHQPIWICAQDRMWGVRKGQLWGRDWGCQSRRWSLRSYSSVEVSHTKNPNKILI